MTDFNPVTNCDFNTPNIIKFDENCPTGYFKENITIYIAEGFFL